MMKNHFWIYQSNTLLFLMCDCLFLSIL
jgi:hypothetical protein